MRVTFKFSIGLLAGVVTVLAVDALTTWKREVEFFQHDMREDHELVGDLVRGVIHRIWKSEGADAALGVPKAIEEGERRLTLRWADGDAIGIPDTVPEPLRPVIARGEAAAVRDRAFQHTYVPIQLPAGEPMVLEIRESLAPEQEFSNTVLWRAGLVAAAILTITGVLTVVLGMAWVGRPMQALCAGAERIGRGDFSPVRLDGGDEFGTLAGAMNDMSSSLAEAAERVQRETEQRLAALQQLRHADRLATVGQLAAGVAHELGTPLNVVLSLADMLGKGDIAPTELADSATMIGDQAKQMTAIIRQLLDFARPRKPDRVQLDLGEVAARALALLEVMAQKRGVTLVLECAAPALARVDLSQLQQVLANLVVNAIHASRAGGVVTVRVTAAAPTAAAGSPNAADSWVRIDVVDTGCGIEPDAVEHLFEPFYTTKGVGEGTGLGLSVSRGIVVEHGGHIEVASTPGVGSCFSVVLPGEVAA